MKSESTQPAIDSFQIRKEIAISAPIEIAFGAILDDLGPENQMPGGKPFPMKLEAFPGGRWYRDLGNNTGHLWGHIQVIKPPTLLEICGPLMMSYAATNHLQYRLTAEKDETRLVFVHMAVGLIRAEDRDNVSKGWEYWLERIAELAKRKHSGKK
jgi:uncharacterized protein YndB with AHSA1/START domain